MLEIFRFIIIIPSLAGFLLSFYICRKKRKQEKMTCPIGSDCDSVIHSEYSAFLGIPLETIGIFYYGIILLGYCLISTAEILNFPTSIFFLITISTLAFLFSIYLTIIQGAVLKEW